jgi:hypothetical protein
MLLPAECVAARGLGKTGYGRDFLSQRKLHRELDHSGKLGSVLASFQSWIERMSAVPHLDIAGLIAAAKVPDLPDWTAGMLGRSLPFDVAVRKLKSLVSSRSLRPASEDALRTALASFVERIANARASPPAPLAPTGNERLDSFRAGLAHLREPLLAGWPPGIVAAQLGLREEGDSLEMTLHFDNSWIGDFADSDEDGSPFPPGRAPQRTLRIPDLSGWERKLSLLCYCPRDACVHRAAALDALLAYTATPAGGRAIASMLFPPWQRALDLLAAPDREDKRTAPGSLSFVFGQRGARVYFHLEGKRGPSRRGTELHADLAAYLPRLRGQDRKIAELFALSQSGRSRESNPFYGDAVLLLAGHPCVRLEQDRPFVPVQVERASVRVVEAGEGVRVAVMAGGREVQGLQDTSGFASSAGHVLARPSEGVLRLVVLPKELQRLLAATSRFGAAFPREALPGLVGALPRLESAAQVELPDNLVGEEVPTASRPVLRLSPLGPGALLEVRVEPLAGGPLFVPGHGAPRSAAFDGSRRRFALRDFDRELVESSVVVAELGLDLAATTEPYSFALESGEASVETLRRVHHLAQRGVGVEWNLPRPKFTSPADIHKLSLRIEKKRDWFGLEGEVKVDDRRVELAALLEAARSRRRWVQLGPGDYAELSEELIARLTPLSHVAGEEKTPTLTLGTVPLIEALVPEVEELDAAEEWLALTTRLRKARERPYLLPSGLRAGLRDYQVEGFRWLSRLAEFGAGACLADDMGLGKTLQALALLMARAPLGPALVVAPTSVLHAWRVEAERFAPSLRLRLFHEGDRDLSAAGPGDVVVVSWTVFAREADLFSKTRFATAILDEAQAIKNSATQRARAAHALDAGFVVAFTGTPVENHAGEI